jgi:CubicO group peptidase (beta-lactamase class C family)
MIFRISFFFLFLVLWITPVKATEKSAPDPAQNIQVKQALRLFQEWANAHIAYDDIPGASAGIVFDQKLIWSGGFGYADLQRRTPATADTIYGICSISKLFTAISVLQQRDAGKVRLDDPISQYLSYANLETASKDSPAVTVESVLTHSSGLPRESAHPYWTDPNFTFPTKEEIISGLRSQKMLYPTDRYFQYSNLGLTFAGEIVEKVTARSYEQYVQDEILKPLGLSHTTPYLPEDQKGKLLATGYSARTREGNRDVMPFYQTRGIAPAAGFASNVKDLASFASWQFRLLEKGGTEVLKSSTLREMHRVHWVDPDWKTTWGLGFMVLHEGDQTFVGHGGACPGYFTSLVMNPKEKIAGIIMMNAMNVNTWRVADQLIKIVGPAIKEATDSDHKKLESPKADMERYAGRYWAAWGETIVVPWKEGVAALDVPSREPMEDLVELKFVRKNVFRRIRKDGDDLGEEIVFETGPDGKVTRLFWHQNYSKKM